MLNSTGTLSLSKPLPAGITEVMTKWRHWTVQELFLCQNHCLLELQEWWPSEGTEQYRNSFFVKTIACWNHRSDDQAKALNNTGTLSLSRPLSAGITGVMTKWRHWTIQEFFLCLDTLESLEWQPSEGPDLRTMDHHPIHHLTLCTQIPLPSHLYLKLGPATYPIKIKNTC